MPVYSFSTQTLASVLEKIRHRSKFTFGKMRINLSAIFCIALKGRTLKLMPVCNVLKVPFIWGFLIAFDAFKCFHPFWLHSNCAVIASTSTREFSFTWSNLFNGRGTSNWRRMAWIISAVTSTNVRPGIVVGNRAGIATINFRGKHLFLQNFGSLVRFA